MNSDSDVAKEKTEGYVAEEKVPLLDSTTEEKYSVTFKERILSCRWRVGYTTCLVVSCSVLLRMNMTMVIVCMKPQYTTVTVVQNGTNVTIPDPYLDYYVTWDSEMEGLLISAYYVGSLFTLTIAGKLRKISGKKLVVVFILLLVVSSVITPPLAFVSPYLVLLMRMINGFTRGVIEPCTTQILSNWAPLQERAQMMVLLETANSFGGIGNFLLSGLICSIPAYGGWPFIFYIFGVINLLPLVLWNFVVYDTPDNHPRITSAELKYINTYKVTSTSSKDLKIPWRHLLTSKAVWGYVLGFLSFSLLFTMMAVCLPLYLKQVLQMDATLAGVVSSLTFVGRLIGAPIFGYLADWVFSKQWFSIAKIRKTFQAIGLVGSAPFLVGLGYLNKEDYVLSVVLIIMFWLVATAMNSGFRVNVADIAPRFAGVLCGITITLNSIAASIAPMMLSVLTPNGTAEEWRVVYLICAGSSLTGAVLFAILASGEEQEWAKDPNDINKNIIHVVYKGDKVLTSRYKEPDTTRSES